MEFYSIIDKLNDKITKFSNKYGNFYKINEFYLEFNSLNKELKYDLDLFIYDINFKNSISINYNLYYYDKSKFDNEVGYIIDNELDININNIKQYNENDIINIPLTLNIENKIKNIIQKII